MKLQAIFFDRDGTLGNLKDIRFPNTFVPFAGISETFEQLHGMGLKVLIASNQSCIARGTDNGYDFAAEFSAYGADSWFLCPHDAHDGCDCRKPKPGLLLRAAEQYGLDLKRCVMVGDRWTDMKCGFDAGTRCIFLRNEAATPLPTDNPEKMYWIERADAQTDDLRLIPQIVLAWGG